MMYNPPTIKKFLNMNNKFRITYVILSMLISFNIINTNNRIISIVMDFLFKLIEPLLRVIRNVIPNFGAIDVSPVILIIIIEAFQYIMTKYGF